MTASRCIRSLRLLSLAVGTAGCTAALPAVVVQPLAHYGAVVDARYSGHDGDVVAGNAMFRTLTSAIAAAPDSSPTPFVVFVRKGRYHEKVSVDKANITLRGEGRDSTILTFDASADARDPAGGTYGTQGSFTLRVSAPDFRAEHLTIENAFDFRANAARAESDPAKVRNTQAVALHLDHGSDRAAIVDCIILGWQDTVFANAGRAWFHDCIILGQTDFVFGAGTAVFDDCDIVSRGAGYIAAPSTPLLQRFGFVFIGSRLGRESQAVRKNTVALGRPWHPSSNPNVNPNAVYIDCNLDDHIIEEGWTQMGGFGPETARFFEYHDHGVGAVKNPARRVLSDVEAVRYAPSEVLGGWEPELATHLKSAASR
ncbi:pectinesterase family protein [soil metagenome]